MRLRQNLTSREPSFERFMDGEGKGWWRGGSRRRVPVSNRCIERRRRRSEVNGAVTLNLSPNASKTNNPKHKTL